MLKHTALTTDTISRFEFLVDADKLTVEQAKEVEHLAYCANMGSKDNVSAWKRFCYLVKEYLNIDLAKMEADAELNGESEFMYHARRGKVSILTYNGKTRLISSMWCIVFHDYAEAINWLQW